MGLLQRTNIDSADVLTTYPIARDHGSISNLIMGGGLESYYTWKVCINNYAEQLHQYLSLVSA